MTTTPNKFVAYYRVSTDKQGKSGLGLEGQQRKVRAYLDGKGWPPLAEFIEVESGRSKSRPKLADALRLCRVHGATLVVAKLDRLARNAHFLMSIVESGVKVVFLDLPDIGTGPVPDFLLRQMASVAELEAGLISQRTRAALEAAKARGVVLGGDRGHKPTRAVIEAGAAAKKAQAAGRAADLRSVIDQVVAEGHASYREIARQLNERGIPTPSRRGAWQATTVARIFKRSDLK
jgi:DNA invertase Pin-like site-specific DNA recombinase